MAALMGKKYGTTKMPAAKSKTVIGFCAFVLSVTGGQVLLGFERSYTWMVLGSMGCGMIEVYSGDLDNISVVVGYILIDILS